ncbi:MAG: DNA polymerase III subunit delta [Rickettsiales bacterium]
MKLNSNTFPSWLQSARSDVRLFLIYGYDQGQVKMLTDDLLNHFRKKFAEINLVNFGFDQIKSDLSMLRNELASVSLFGGQKIVVISSSSATIAKDFLAIIEKDQTGSIIIFQADELRPASSLRKFFEATESCAAIACYKDDQASLEKYIRQFFIDKSVEVVREVPSLLASLLPSDRMVVRAELEKLLLYKDDQEPPINVLDVNSVIADATELSFDDLCVAYVLQDHKNVQKQLSRIMSQDANFMLIIRVMQKYLYRVFEVLCSTEAGISVDAAVGKLSPPVFFKQKDNLIRVVRLLKLDFIKMKMLELINLESKCKSGVLDPQVLLTHFLTLSSSQMLESTR